MARKLPWNTDKQPVSASSTSTPRTTSKSQVEPESADDEERSDSEVSIEPGRKRKLGAYIDAEEQPAETELMKEGLGHDDIYMMVEGKLLLSGFEDEVCSHALSDEFLATAKKFTRQIHQAALEAMEEAAKLKSRETIADISRPVSIAMPSQTRRKLQGITRAQKQGRSVEKLLSSVADGRDDEDDYEDPDAVPAWIGTSLHGLMEAPTKPAPSLARFVRKDAAKTAVGGTTLNSPPNYQSTSLESPLPATTQKSSSVEKEDDDETSSEDEDDLDAVPKAPKIPRPTRAEPEPPRALFSTIQPKSNVSPEPPARFSSENSIESKAITFSSTVITADVPERPTSPASVSVMAQIRKRMAERRQRASS